tara:strand:- start:417 stop:551 length:135 start_codon:yes stop_codon:yes gene_type:complete
MFSSKGSPKAQKRKEKDAKKRVSSRSRSNSQRELAQSAKAGGAG